MFKRIAFIFFVVLSLSMSSVYAKEKETDYSLVAIYAGCTVRITVNAVLFFQCTDGAFIKALNKFKKNNNITAIVQGRDMNNVQGYIVTAQAPVLLDGRENK